MQYAEHAFYRSEYLGDRITDESTFNRLATRASAKLDHYTMGRISQTDCGIAVRLAVCSMAEILFWEEKRKNAHEGREISSESNDGYSVSFGGSSESDMAAFSEKSLYQAAYAYLSQTGLMDFGV